jgi:hypothetical protein
MQFVLDDQLRGLIGHIDSEQPSGQRLEGEHREFVHGADEKRRAGVVDLFVDNCERKAIAGAEVAIPILADESDPGRMRQLPVPFASRTSPDLLRTHGGTAPRATEHDELVDAAPGLELSQRCNRILFSVGRDVAADPKTDRKALGAQPL